MTAADPGVRVQVRTLPDGITVLFHARRRARQQGLAFAVAARPDVPVRRVLSLTQMDQALQLHDTLEQALSASPHC